MKNAKITLWASLTIILSISYLKLSQNKFTSTGWETSPITGAEMQPAYEATIQILMFPTDSLESLALYFQRISINDVLSRNNGPYRYELGLGTLVSHKGEIILITHDHWGYLDSLGMVQFRDAAGDPLLELDGETFKNLIRYQDGGTLILGKSAGGDRSDYLRALVEISQAKYGRRILPAKLEDGENVEVGDSLIVVRQGRSDTNAVELAPAIVQSIEKRWGQTVYKLRVANEENIMPGDSGGGLWLGGGLVGNMWKSKFTYGWDWSSLEVNQVWTETSYAARLPVSVSKVIQSMGAQESLVDVETQASGAEY